MVTPLRNRVKLHYKSESVRRKAKPSRTRDSIKRRSIVVERRAKLTPDERHKVSAMDWAAEIYRQTVRQETRVRRKGAMTVKKKRQCARVFQPPNMEKLIKLIPHRHRSKNICIGDSAVFVFPNAQPVKAWYHGVVVDIRPHKSDSYWFLFRWPKECCKSKNPYIAIDAPNVFKAPENSDDFEIAFPNAYPKRGVYVLYCPHLKEYYVGQSNDVPNRIIEHRNTDPRMRGYSGAAWTKRWEGKFYRVPPCTVNRGDLHDWEMRETSALREMYGCRKVRGFCYTNSQE